MILYAAKANKADLSVLTSRLVDFDLHFYIPLFLCFSIGLGLRFGLLLRLRLLRLCLRLGMLGLLSGSLLRLIGLMLRLGMLWLALRFGLLGLLSGSLMRLIGLLLSVGSSRSVLLLFTLLGLFGLTLLSGRLSVGAILCLLLFLGFVKTADIGISKEVGGTMSPVRQECRS